MPSNSIHVAAMNIGVHVAFPVSVFVFFRYIPRNGIAGSYHMVVVFLVFWETSILFSTVAAPIYIPTNGIWGFPFLHILANTCYFLSFWWQPFWQVWGDTSLWFLFAFPWWLVILSIFLCAHWSSAFPLWKNEMSIQFFCPFFNWVVFLFACFRCWIVWAIYKCWILAPYQSYHLQIFYPIQ